MSINTTSKKIKDLTYLSIFTAIVFVLQLLSFLMRGPMFSLTFVLVPIVIAVAICGLKAGPWLGFVFGIAVLVTGDANLFLAFKPGATVFLVLLKGFLAGLCAALVYCALEKKNKYLAVALAAVTAPIVNTGVFFVGCLIFFRDLVISLVPGTQNVALTVITAFIGINFFIEVAVNLVLVPMVYRLVEIVKNRK
jgi:uncharacterized membrane protein